MTTTVTKHFRGHTVVKDADQGIASIVFATLDVIDHDGDIMTKDTLPWDTAVVISAYGHASWEGGTANLPIGKGMIRRDGATAVCDLKFFLDTPGGRDTFTVVKELSADDLQEWSFSLHEVEAERITKDGRPARLLKRIGLVKEVSPTLMGAGIDTGTLLVKGRAREGVKQLHSSIRLLLSRAGSERWGGSGTYAYVDDYDLDEGYVVYWVEAFVDGSWTSSLVKVSFTRTDTSVTLGDDETEVHPTTVYIPKRYTEHAEAVMAEVDELVKRTDELMVLRKSEGKRTPASSIEVLTKLDERLANVKSLLTSDDVEDDPTDTDPVDDPADEAATDDLLAIELLELERSLNTGE